MKKAPIKHTSLYIPLALHAQIQASAEKHQRSFNNQLLWLATQTLNNEEAPSGTGPSDASWQIRVNKDT